MQKAMLNSKAKITNKKSSNGVTTYDVVMGGSKKHTVGSHEMLFPYQFEDLKSVEIMYSENIYKNSLESLSNLPFLVDHPWLLLSDMENKSDFIKKNIKGVTKDAFINDDGNVQTSVTIFDSSIVSDIENNKNAVSWGGAVKIKWLNKDEAKEKGYHGELTEIIGDHLSLVDVGRCGDDCKILNSEPYKKIEKKNTPLENNKIESQNSKRKKMKTIVLNGTSFEVEDNVSEAFSTALASKDGVIKALNNKISDLAEDAEKFQKLQEKTRLDAVVNMAKDLDADFAIEDKDTIISVVNRAMDTDLKDEVSAVASMTAFHKAIMGDKKADKVIQNKAIEEVAKVQDEISDIYKTAFGGK